MATYKRATKPGLRSAQETIRLLQSPDAGESIKQLRQRYGRYALPSEELKAMLDQALGERTLTKELYASRND